MRINISQCLQFRNSVILSSSKYKTYNMMEYLILRQAQGDIYRSFLEN